MILEDADVDAHRGGHCEWDPAPPVAVAASTGLNPSRFDGAPSRPNQPSPLLPDLFVCRIDVANTVLVAKREMVE